MISVTDCLLSDLVGSKEPLVPARSDKPSLGRAGMPPASPGCFRTLWVFLGMTRTEYRLPECARMALEDAPEPEEPPPCKDRFLDGLPG